MCIFGKEEVAYSDPPNPVAAFKGPTSIGRGREGKRKERERKERGERGGNGKEERASHTAAAMGLAKPTAGSAPWSVDRH